MASCELVSQWYPKAASFPPPSSASPEAANPAVSIHAHEPLKEVLRLGVTPDVRFRSDQTRYLLRLAPSSVFSVSPRSRREPVVAIPLKSGGTCPCRAVPATGACVALDASRALPESSSHVPLPLETV